MGTTGVIPLIVIVGPTASGKSRLAMDIAKQFGGEIICADSRTVYRGMDIGTAKPTAKDQQEIPHHLLDVVEPGQQFNAAAFKRLANAAIRDIRRRGKLPVLVGGTGLYINAVIFDYKFGPAADPKLRDVLSSKTIEELQEICHKRNIEMPVNNLNKRHLIRAVELNGLIQHKKSVIADVFVVGVAPNKEKLQKRIEDRADFMFSQDILQEVHRLAKRFGWGSEAMKGNIYRIVRGVIEEGNSLDTAKEESVKSDIRLAKRQMTWFKANPYIHWGSTHHLKSEIKSFLRKYNMQPVQ